MHRLFGRAKTPAPAPPPPPSIGDHVASLEGRGGELEKKIAACDAELLALKAQLSRTPEARRGPLKQKALVVLKRRNVYEQQRVRFQRRADQSAPPPPPPPPHRLSPSAARILRPA